MIPLPGGSMGPRYVFHFYLVKSHKIAIAKAREKISTILESLEF